MTTSLVRLGLLLLTTASTALAQCTLCINTQVPETFNADKPLDIPDFPFLDSCGSLNNFVGALPEESYECELAQTIGTLCGCPIPEDACFFCGSAGVPIENPSATIPELEYWFGFAPSCEVAQAYFHVNATEQDCIDIGEMNVASTCGCPANTINNTDTTSNSNSTIVDTTANTTDENSTGVVIADPPVNTERCTLCKDSSANYTLIDRELNIPGYPSIHSCSTLQSFVGLLPLDSYECGILQTITTLCGCPVPSEELLEEEGSISCSLCGQRRRRIVGNPQKEIMALEYLFGFVPTCELAEAYLLINGTEEDCDLAHEFIAPYCECYNPNGEQNGWPTPTPGTSCSLCRDGQPVPYPNKTTHFFDYDYYPIETCGEMELWVQLLPEDDEMCWLSQSISSFCGCPEVEDSCGFCQHEIPQDRLKQRQNFYYESDDDPSWSVAPPGLIQTCELAQSYSQGVPRDSDECWWISLQSKYCGCEHTVQDIFQATRKWQRLMLQWIPRVSGMLALIGASVVVIDIISDPQKRSRVYHQIVSGMVVFDIITAVCFILGPLPVYEKFRDFNFGVDGAQGNYDTCIAQGFFVQLGATTVFYNVSLAVYYKLVIVHGWREDRLKKYRWAFHGCPCLVGLALALAGIQYYDISTYYCHFLSNFPYHWFTTVVFFIIPIGIALFVLVVLTLNVYMSVRKKFHLSSKWSMRSVPNSNESNNRSQGQRQRSKRRHPLEKEVFWQSVCYLAAFWVTWPFTLTVFFFSDQYFWMGVLVSVVLPIQGFNNALVYFRRRIKRRLSRSSDATRTVTSFLRWHLWHPWHPRRQVPSSNLSSLSSVEEKPRRISVYEEPAQEVQEFTERPEVSAGSHTQPSRETPNDLGDGDFDESMNDDDFRFDPSALIADNPIGTEIDLNADNSSAADAAPDGVRRPSLTSFIRRLNIGTQRRSSHNSKMAEETTVADDRRTPPDDSIVPQQAPASLSELDEDRSVSLELHSDFERDDDVSTGAADLREQLRTAELPRFSEISALPSISEIEAYQQPTAITPIEKEKEAEDGSGKGLFRDAWVAFTRRRGRHRSEASSGDKSGDEILREKLKRADLGNFSELSGVNSISEVSQEVVDFEDNDHKHDQVVDSQVG